VLQVTKIWVRSFDTDHLDVFWEIGTVKAPASDSTPHEIYNYDFYVLRSEAPAGPYDEIGGPFRDTYMFRDLRVSLLNKWRQYYYKIKIVDRARSETQDFGPAASHEPEPDLIAAEIIRQEDKLFREFIGRRCWLFPARTFGPRCSCFDATLNRITRSQHLPCFGTGWLGGYMFPVEVFVQFDPNSRQTALLSTGETQPVVAQARCSSFPPMKSRDILIESENVRWRVVSMVPTERLRAVVHQEIQLNGIPRSDIEYTLPLNVDPKTLTPAAERNFRNSQNVDADTVSNLLNFWGHRR
jgi:hypothetical protein